MTLRFKLAASLAGWAALVFLHLYRLGEVPGLHYDEAWAMNFSWAIAQGARPLHAMSPYTMPWAHYWAAAWLALLAPSVTVFRLSQVCLALAGLVALSGSLPRHLRPWFPWACVLIPGLVLNHRFTVELNGFHVLCFGLLAAALRDRRFFLAAAAALVGTTAHVLFYAVPLALLAAVCREGKELPARARAAAAVFFALSGLFFVRVLEGVPEKGKGGVLLLSAAAGVLLLAMKAERWRIWKAPALDALAILGALIYYFNGVFFGGGIWTASIYSGLEAWKAEWPFVFPGLLALAVSLLRAQAGAPRFASRAFLFGTVVLGVLMLKPAPRYFELWFLAAAWLLPWAFLSFPGRLTRLGLLAGCAAYAFLLLPREMPIPFDRDLRFLFFKDSSRDFLDKQTLARFLGGSGCRRGDIQTHDPRLKEELDALALGDWPVNGQNACEWSVVSRATEDGATGFTLGEFLLRK